MIQTHAVLQALVDAAPGVTLTDSHTLYPEARGDNLPLITLVNKACSATVALHGAQLLSFTPAGGDDLLWLSPHCNFSSQGALRGGIPLCLPWFGEHPSDTSKPKHGFARNQPWELTHISAADSATDNAIDSDTCELEFTLTHSANTLFNHSFTAKLTMALGRECSLALSLTNTSSSAFDCSWVMHTYFAINDLDSVQVLGLENRDYLDKTQSNARFTQEGPVSFKGELDRVYEQINNPVHISQRNITLTHQNCPSVVVWNPGATLAASIGDIGPGNERGFVCVERGACSGDAWHLGPNESLSASMNISV
ncbi:MAG TPA: D-hexose-6-phosphate mutarotase [Cellvibrionaceae bacterium]